MDSWSTETSRFIRTRSSETRPAKPSRRAARPPVTQVPPPNGTTATWCSTAQARTAATSSCEPGRTTASGASDRSPARARSRSGVDFPRVRSRRVSSSTSTCSAPRTPRSESSRSSGRADGGTVTASRAGVSLIPKASSIRPRAESGRAAAAAGSPQRWGCISTCCVSSLMCYSVTHDVTSSHPPSRGGCREGAQGRLPRRGAGLHPRRGLAAYDADRGRSSCGRLADDDLPHLGRTCRRCSAT